MSPKENLRTYFYTAFPVKYKKHLEQMSKVLYFLSNYLTRINTGPLPTLTLLTTVWLPFHPPWIACPLPA